MKAIDMVLAMVLSLVMFAIGLSLNPAVNSADIVGRCTECAVPSNQDAYALAARNRTGINGDTQAALSWVPVSVAMTERIEELEARVSRLEMRP